MSWISILAFLIWKCATLSDSYFIIEAPELNVKEFKKEFRVYWNVPTFQCASKKIPFDKLYEKFGIIQNNGDRFNGEKITILYELGDFPSIFKNKTSGEYEFINNGVPQEGNLQEHLVAFKEQLLEKIPDPFFDGVGVIDFEMWRPVFDQNFGNLDVYRKRSIEIEKERHSWWLNMWIKKEAAIRFETAARKFMESTLVLAKQMRPNALWGYYGYPHCFNMRDMDMKEDCVKSIPGANDNIYWLWAESTALFPSIYSSKKLTNSQLPFHIKGRIKESARVRLEDTPILPYFWFRYRDAEFFSQEDLSIALNTLYQSKASGVIIWGSSNDVNTVDKCKKLYNYVETILGPNIAKYTQRSKKSSNAVNNENNLFKFKSQGNRKILESEEILLKESSTNYDFTFTDETTQSAYYEEIDFTEYLKVNYDFTFEQSLTTLRDKEDFTPETSTEIATNMVSQNFITTEEDSYNDDNVPNAIEITDDYLIIIENSTTNDTFKQDTTNTNIDDDYLIIVRDNYEDRLTKYNNSLEQPLTTKSPSNMIVKSSLENVTEAYQDAEYDYYDENTIEMPATKDKLSDQDESSDYIIVVDNNYTEKDTFEAIESKRVTDTENDYLIIVNDFNNLRTSNKSNTDYVAIDNTKSNSTIQFIPYTDERSTTEESLDDFEDDDEFIPNKSYRNEVFNSGQDESNYLIVIDYNFTDVNTFTPSYYTDSTDIKDDYLIIPKHGNKRHNFTINSDNSNANYVPNKMKISTTQFLESNDVTLSTENENFSSEIFSPRIELNTPEITTPSDFLDESTLTEATSEGLITLEIMNNLTANVLLNEMLVTDRSVDSISNLHFIKTTNDADEFSASHISMEAMENEQYIDKASNKNDAVEETKSTYISEYKEFKNSQSTESGYSSKLITSSEKYSIPTEGTFSQNDFTDLDLGTDLTRYSEINEEITQRKEEINTETYNIHTKDTENVDHIISYIYKK
ncbi:hyaluronidase [Danaus plexippus plexippus]|uniref:Hyaluronidase n=1 Tax=Danaus plexippus plexippus TaxID=278856 RepID=A0A212F1U4_DANPL|nr:hyaluronidase [Danaus plexippus plexippus]